jgi:hypothetical protein
MPEISRFYGMVITMYFDDHPSRAAALATEWAQLHRVELDQNWTVLARGGKVSSIEPLA